MMPLTRWVGCLTVVVACSVARAREGPLLLTGADRGGADVRAAATKFLTCLAEGDAEGAAALFAGPREQAELIPVQARYGKAADALDAAVGSLPKGAKPVAPSTNVFRMRALGARGRLMALNGDEASLAGGMLFDFPLTLRRVEGSWKVVDGLGGRTSPRAFRRFLDDFTRAADATSAKAKARQFKSSDEAVEAFDQLFRPSMNAWLRDPEPAPEEDPFRETPPGPDTAPADWTPPTAQELADAIGRPILSADGRALVAALPATPRLTESRDGVYVSSHAGGIDIFCKGEGRLVSRIILFAGAMGYRRYPGELPHGVKLTDRRRDVERKLGRPTISFGGEGDGKYIAEYAAAGMHVEYQKESARDPDNPVRNATLLAAGPGDAKPVDGPRRPAGLAVRLASIELPRRGRERPPFDGVDTFLDPSDPTGQLVLRLYGNVVLDESGVEKVMLTRVGEDLRTTAIGLHMTEAGARRLAEVTEKNIGRRLGIVIDGKLISAPVVRTRIGKDVVIEAGAKDDPDELRTLCGRLHAAVFALRE